MSELDFMQRAIDLARRGEGLVSPNPMVGAVLVKEGRIIGEGYHRYDWLKHAESFALEMAGEDARGSSLFCSLEPCCHHGRTPPCTDALVSAGIARAVIATRDPDSRVKGHGIELLRDAGIEVEVGLLADEAVKLNEAYNKYVTDHAPFVHVLVGQDSLANWNPSTSLLRMASMYDAIVLGDERFSDLFLDACLSRERHRPFIIVGEANVANALTLKARGSGELFRQLAELRATSVLFLPGSFDGIDPKMVDKATSVQSSDAGEFVEITRLVNESKS
ncbi:MAG TPA: bifunctional diaminohydroxyphosphoribosylaminopyrimidine deaminase/5-amino-6-(5-phosphoribosylamino)uracil reductase RibD [Blastocatellia bacterium]|nr:bifunctional diaminohydroxyphosphoribosylaminopyrimidine deaminase/5-amino-6-(5-phosphoribosylamino)uracil reductase RibD [Blastocatellia bacterium]